jgi:hypothetical protein
LVKKVILGLATMTLSYGAAANAAVLFQDNFDSYNAGELATTDAATANPGPNGGPGNPWWAPPNNNGYITAAVGAVAPHSGTKMLTGNQGSPGADVDQNVVNLTYRVNGGSPISGGVALDFWFYDMNGSGDASNQGYVELGNYSGMPTNADYTTGHSLGSVSQRVILGMTNNAGADLTVYQARALNDTVTVGTLYNTTYINTTAKRSVGWHEGRIVVGPQLGTGGNLIDYYIDNMSTPAAEATTTLAGGYNSLLFNEDFGATPNYFDDVTLSSNPTPEPASVSLLALVGCAVLGRRRRKA